MRNNLQEAFIAKRDEYPTSRSNAIALINKYDEKKVPTTVASEGTVFAQKGKKGQFADKKGGKKKDNKEEENNKEEKKNPCEHKECFVCSKKGHGAKKCPNRPKKEGDDSSESSKSSKKNIVEDFAKNLRNASKQFAQLQAQLEEANSGSSDDEQLHFQFLALPNDVMLK